MTDKEIVQGLIARDNEITRQFLFVKCRPLFRYIISFVFPYEVDYDEFVNELYQELMKDDAQKLRSFQYRSSLLTWLKTVAIRYFISKRDEMIDNLSKESLYEGDNELSNESVDRQSAIMDMERLFSLMDNRRYVFVIQKLMLEDVQPEQLAEELCITTENLYNIKKRAMAALTLIALNDIKK